jgi:molecular chaperone GrpE
MGDNEHHENEEPVIRDKRRIDPETGDVREPVAEAGDDTPASEEPGADDAAKADTADEADELSDADQALLDQAAQDLVADMRSEVKRAQAELYNFRQRVERDRATNRDAVIAEVIRSLLPALDDLARAEAHGDLVEGAPLTLVAQKLRGSFEKFGLRQVGEKGELFDPAFHEAVVQLPSPDVTANTIADVIEPGYVLGDRLVRPAKVAVSVPAE